MASSALPTSQQPGQCPQPPGTTAAAAAAANSQAAGTAFPLEFWTTVLARPAVSPIAVAQSTMNTGIRLPPAFNASAAFQHLLRTANAVPAVPQQNPMALLQQILLGCHVEQQQRQIKQQQQEIMMPMAEGSSSFGEGMPLLLDAAKREADLSVEVLRECQQERQELSCSPIDVKLNKLEALVDEKAVIPLLGENMLDGEMAEDKKEEKPPRGQQQQQRRPRLGGSSVKTAEVWRFFTQRPQPEQAATCMICCKTIKATNSSTTGMIRHLRSCHQPEHTQLQYARYIKALKTADQATRQQLLSQLGIHTQPDTPFEAIQAALERSLEAQLQSPSGGQTAKHTVEALINGGVDGAENNSPNAANGGDRPAAGETPCSPIDAETVPNAQLTLHLSSEQQQLIEQIENFKTCRQASTEKGPAVKKEQPVVPAMVVGGTVQQQQQSAAVKRTADNGMVISPPTAETIGRAGNGETKRRKPLEEEQNGAVGLDLCANQPPPHTLANCTPKAQATLGTKKSRKSVQLPMQQRGEENIQTKNGGQNRQKGAGVAESQQTEASARISEQMAVMFLVDNTEFLLDRIAFRRFIETIVPHYRMPSNEQFRTEIIPRMSKQLQQLAAFQEGLLRNNPFGLPHQQLDCSAASTSFSLSSQSQSSTSPLQSTPSVNNNSIISPSSSTEESGFHEEDSMAVIGVDGAQRAQGETVQHCSPLDELVQLAANRSQNISRSFTYSIDLNGNENGMGGRNEGKDADSG